MSRSKVFSDLGSGLTTSLTSIVMGLLAFQFLTGVGLNLFVAFPDGQPSSLSDAFAAMAIGALPAVHLIVGFALQVLSVVILALFLDSSESKLTILAAVGLASVTAAGLSGTAFIYSGFQEDVYSYFMAVGFVAAFLSYSTLLASHRAKP